MSTFVHSYEHRVRYREVDPMGIVYHAHYLDYFEAARTEALRSTGLSYKSVEDGGLFMPVVDLSVKYGRPAHYDDLLTIETRLSLSASKTRLRFDYEVFRKGESDVLVSGHVTLCFFERARQKPMRAPDTVVSILARLGATASNIDSLQDP